MSIFSFGTFDAERGYKVLDERVVRGSAGIMLLIGFIAFVYGFVVKNYIVLPYLSGFLVVNFLIGIFVNPKLSPTMALARLMVWRQTPLLIGAIQKRFAWTLGLGLSVAIFSMSVPLVNDASWFDPVCLLCLVCLLFLFLETAFGICVGCQTYYLGIRLKLVKKPEVNPTCMGDTCPID